MDRTVVVQAPLLSHIVALRPNEIAARVEHGRERERRRADAEVDEVRRRAPVDCSHCRGSGSANAVAPHHRCGWRRDRGEPARRPLTRRRGGAVGRREETAVVDFRQVESDATAWLLGTVKNGNWNSRQRRNRRLEAIRHGTKDRFLTNMVKAN